MKILICSPEFPPYASGIGNVAYNISETFKDFDINFEICSPVGPDFRIGNHKIMKKTGILGLFYFSNLVLRYFNKNEFDLAWINGNYFSNNPFKNAFVTLHTTYLGYYLQNIGSREYYKVASILEKYYLNKIKKENVKFSGVSPEVCNELEFIGIPRENINYIPNGVDINIFKPSDKKNLLRDKFKIPRDNLVILAVGRLTAQKQPDKIIETFSFIQNSIKNATLVIAGDGELLNQTKKMASKNRLKNVFFLGKVDYSEVKDLYAIADFFLITSKYEGQPLTLLEAISSGLPCIVSDIPNFNIVKEANCGILVNFDNPDSFNEILNYITNYNYNHSKNARNYAVNNLDWKNVAKKYLNEFEKIIS